jgi:hypothetical protein
MSMASLKKKERLLEKEKRESLAEVRESAF